jgi:hypothetical protein
MQRKQEAYSISLFLLSTINIDDLSFIYIITKGVTVKIQQVAVRVNYENPSNDAKGGEKGDPNRNPWLAKMVLYIPSKSHDLADENDKILTEWK